MAVAEQPTTVPQAHRTALFGVVAPTAGWAPPLRFLLRRARALRAIGRLAPGDLLEVGCGAGALLDELSHGGWRAIGIDSSERARQVAQAIAAATGGKQRVLAAAEPDWSARFDLICALEVLEHIEDDRRAMRQWADWLRPGGRLLISVPAHRRRWNAGDEWAGHYRRYDRNDLIEVVETAGLAVEHVECYGFPLGNLTERLGDPAYLRKLRERAAAPTSKAAATADSGVERLTALRMFRWLDTFAGRTGLRAALALQAATCRTEWGCGFLLQARRP
jgi:SAM-dependent methyltransferase